MQQFLVFAATGLGAGAVLAALALGLVVTYKGTGVVNFAAASVGIWSGLVFTALRENGTYVFPVALIPSSIHLGRTPPTWLCLVVAVLTSAALGLVLHLVVFRPLRNAPSLAKLIASTGVLLAMQAIEVLRFGSSTTPTGSILPTGTIAVGIARVPVDRLYLAVIALALGVAFAVWFHRTRLGTAVRAAAENELFTSLAGRSPDRLAALSWVLASSAVGFMVVLGAPLTGLDPTSYALLVVPALACALVGRLTAILPAVVAGLVLGVIQSEVTFYATKPFWPHWAQTGAADAVPLIAIIVILTVTGKALPNRDSVQVERLPDVHMPQHRVLFLCGVAGLALLAIVLTGGGYRFGIIMTMIIGVIGLSFVVLTGLLGQVSFAQAAFAGLAGFTLSKLTGVWSIGFPWGPMLSVAITGVLGLLLALPALRVRGTQLAVVTLAAALALDQMLFNNPSFNNLQTGNPVAEPHLLGLDLSIRGGANTARLGFALLVLVVLVASIWAVINWARAGTGRLFLAVRANERASAALGVNITRVKLLGFAMAAALAGLGGTLLSYSQGSVSAASFTTFIGVSFLVYAYLGGVTSVSGALLTGFFAPLGITYVVVTRLVPSASGPSYQLISAIALIATAIFNPEGVAGAALSRLAKRRTRSDSQSAPTPSGTWVSGRDRAGTVELGKVLLEVRGLSVAFGGVQALRDVSLKVGAGQVVGLIGANGAGKTTLLDALSGFVPYTGAVAVDGERIDGLRAHERAGRGLARTWQSLELFETLSVEDNLRVAFDRASVRAVLEDTVRPSRSPARDAIESAMTSVGVIEHRDVRPSELSLGQQKLVGISRAIVASPTVLLLDEPAAGLSAPESRALGASLHSLIGSERCAVLVEHDVEVVLDTCDYVYVLDIGAVIAEGAPEAVRHDPRVISAYLGSDVLTAAPEIANQQA